MYELITGKVLSIQPTYVVIETGGIGYKLLVANPFRFSDFLTTSLTLYVELVVREDSMTLYGFKNLEEKQLFLTLNKVSGIGPKSAMSILALDDHQGLINAIESGDSKYLTKFPGVGKKTAQQMVLDLKGTLGFMQDTDTMTHHKATQTTEDTTQTMGTILDDVFEALEGLGYSAKEIKRIETPLKSGAYDTTQKALSAAFKLLRK